MKVSVKYFGLAATIMKRKTDIFELSPESTAGALIDLIADGEDHLFLAATVLVNNEKADRDTVLHDGDVVTIMNRLAGG